MRSVLAGVPLPNRNRRAFRARYLMAGLCGLSLLAAAGCGSSAGAGSTVSATVTIAAVPSVDDAALYLAKTEGRNRVEPRMGRAASAGSDSGPASDKDFWL